jgi:hypothetical protein
MQRVENGLIYIVKNSEMTGDEPKWLDGLVRSSDTAGLKLRKDVCMK